MPIVTRTISYGTNIMRFSAVLAFDTDWLEPVPGLMIAHGWMGQGQFEVDRAVALATLGYAGLAIDMYGAGRRATRPAEAAPLMAEIDTERILLKERILMALDALKALPEVDAARTAAIGYCFGGKCVLDLARCGADVCGVVSLHGVYDPPPFPSSQILAKLLICHGWDDPLCPPAAVLGLADELSALAADWQVHAYGGTRHAFTSPKAASPEMGLEYSHTADRRSWRAVETFLSEIFI